MTLAETAPPATLPAPSGEPTRAELIARIEALEHERDRFSSLVDNLVHGVAMWDREGRLSLWNRGYEHYLEDASEVVADGVAFESVVRAVADVRVAAGNAGSAEEHVERRLQHHRVPGSPIAFRRRDGRVFVLHEIKLPDDAFIETFTDVTELKLREEELERTRDEMEQFAYTVSHDLHAPLRGIHHLTEFIEDALASDAGDEVRRNLAELRARVGKMRALIDALLAFARAGQAHCPPETVDAREVVEALAQQMDRPAGIDVVPDPGLPTLHTGRAPFETVLRNLLANAFAHHDRACGRVRVSAVEAAGMFRFRIADDGPGVPDEARQRIFRAFERNAVAGAAGSGLGLTICERLVRAAGGEIGLAPDGPGRGACFEFTWPRKWTYEPA